MRISTRRPTPPAARPRRQSRPKSEVERQVARLSSQLQEFDADMVDEDEHLRQVLVRLFHIIEKLNPERRIRRVTNRSGG